MLGVVLTVLIGGGFGAYTLFRPATPASIVQKYFGELADGDAAGALELVADETDYSSADYPFLVPRALSEARTRPSDLRILGTDATSEITGEKVEIVRVSYKIRDATVTQNFLLTKPQDGGPAYVLHEPFLGLSVSSAAGRRLTINGIAATAEQAEDAVVFPGAYTATAQGNALVAGATQTATVQTRESEEAAAVIDFGTPALAPGAQEAVLTKVRQQLDACAQSTNSEPTDCPFSAFVFASDVSVRWTIATYPTLTVALSSDPTADQQVDISTDAEGVAHYVATYTDDFTGKKQNQDGDVSFSVQGGAAASGSDITVSIS